MRKALKVPAFTARSLLPAQVGTHNDLHGQHRSTMKSVGCPASRVRAELPLTPRVKGGRPRLAMVNPFLVAAEMIAPVR